MRDLRRRRIRWGAIAAGAAIALVAALPAAATDSTVAIGGLQFSPGTVTVDQGETVTWNWVGPDTNHTVTSDPGQADQFNSDPANTFGPPPGGTYSHRFLTPGTFTYFCRVHSFMKGRVVVNPVAQSPSSPTTVTQGVGQAPKPSFRECLSQRNFTIRLREPAGAHLASATVTVNGKPVAVKPMKVNGRRRLTAQVDLRGLPKGQYQVEITAKTRGGRTLQGTRRYSTCSPKIPSYFPPKL